MDGIIGAIRDSFILLYVCYSSQNRFRTDPQGYTSVSKARDNEWWNRSGYLRCCYMLMTVNDWGCFDVLRLAKGGSVFPQRIPISNTQRSVFVCLVGHIRV